LSVVDVVCLVAPNDGINVSFLAS